MILKNKILFYTLMLWFATTLNAEWDTISFKEHIEKSSVIIVAEFQKEKQREDTDIGLSQLVSFEANESIKGEISSSFFVKGQAFMICMPQKFFEDIPKTKYLLFLKQEGSSSTYSLVHGERSALVIKNSSVGWIADKKKIDMGDEINTPLADVKKQIRDFLSI